MTTKIDPGSNNNGSSSSSNNGNNRSDNNGQVQPALGETWANFCTHRIRLGIQQSDFRRTAHLFKSPNIMDQSVPFAIEADGIRDVKDYKVANTFSN